MKSRTMKKMPVVKAKRGLTRANPRSGSAPPVKAVAAKTNVLNDKYHGQAVMDTTKMTDKHGPFTKGRGRMGKVNAPKTKAGRKSKKKD